MNCGLWTADHFLTANCPLQTANYLPQRAVYKKIINSAKKMLMNFV